MMEMSDRPRLLFSFGRAICYREFLCNYGIFTSILYADKADRAIGRFNPVQTAPHK